MKKRSPNQQRHIETGVSVYNRDDVEGISHSKAAALLFQSAISACNSNHKPVDDFNAHPDNKRRPAELPELVLPESVHPHDAIMEFARVAFDVYGGTFAASVDTSKSKISNSATDGAIEQLQGLAEVRSFGFIFLVQRQQDLLNPRIERLRQDVGGIAVPSMHLLTLRPEETTPMERGEQTDPGPGLANLG